MSAVSDGIQLIACIRSASLSASQPEAVFEPYLNGVGLLVFLLTRLCVVGYGIGGGTRNTSASIIPILANGKGDEVS